MEQLPSSYALTVRFPSGTEFWQADALPEVGSTMSRQGRVFVVTSREELPDGGFALNVVEQQPRESLEPLHV